MQNAHFASRRPITFVVHLNINREFPGVEKFLDGLPKRVHIFPRFALSLVTGWKYRASDGDEGFDGLVDIHPEVTEHESGEAA